MTTVEPKETPRRIKDIIKNKYFGYLMDLAIVFAGVAVLSSGAGFLLDYRILVLGVLLIILIIRGICLLTLSDKLMNTGVTTIIIAVLIGAFLFGRSGGELPKPFRSRTCQGRGWRRHFPMVQNKEIRVFLLFFVKAFALSDNEKLRLNPDDKIQGIYKALYPSQWMPDALEFETLERDLRQKYSVELGNIWKVDLTLGELFAECLKAMPNTRSDHDRA